MSWTTFTSSLLPNIPLPFRKRADWCGSLTSSCATYAVSGTWIVPRDLGSDTHNSTKFNRLSRQMLTRSHQQLSAESSLYDIFSCHILLHSSGGSGGALRVPLRAHAPSTDMNMTRLWISAFASTDRFPARECIVGTSTCTRMRTRKQRRQPFVSRCFTKTGNIWILGWAPAISYWHEDPQHGLVGTPIRGTVLYLYRKSLEDVGPPQGIFLTKEPRD